MPFPPQQRPAFRAPRGITWGQRAGVSDTVRYVYDEKQLRKAIYDLSRSGTELDIAQYSTGYKFVPGASIVIGGPIHLRDTVTIPKSLSGLSVSCSGGCYVTTDAALATAFDVYGLFCDFSNFQSDPVSTQIPNIWFKLQALEIDAGEVVSDADYPAIWAGVRNSRLRANTHAIQLLGRGQYVMGCDLDVNPGGGSAVADVYMQGDGCIVSDTVCRYLLQGIAGSDSHSISGCKGNLNLASDNCSVSAHTMIHGVNSTLTVSGTFNQISGRFANGTISAANNNLAGAYVAGTLTLSGDGNTVSALNCGTLTVSGDDNGVSGVQATTVNVTGQDNALAGIRAGTIDDTGSAGNNALAGAVCPSVTWAGTGSVSAATT